MPYNFVAVIASVHKAVTCLGSASIVLGGECRSASAALLIHRLGADNAKNLRE